MKKVCGIVITILTTILICSAAVGRPGRAKSEYKNLKVLPKNISSKALSKIMVDEFSDALGVGCGFCHARGKDSLSIDYASDAKPEKEMARMMMRMTLRVNKRFFMLKHPALDGPLVVTCNTCHKGQSHPEAD
ncbi:MAG TPA: c-type cytochrome [Puia sp.]|nr:c-type cytochrome [Puia sp.]